MTYSPRDKALSFYADNLQIEGVLHLPGSPALYPAVVVCHPHPLYGGDMDNNVVMGVCRALTARGMAALRFNFRGTGSSHGTHTGGPGEVNDALAALDCLRSQADVDSARLGLVGYSFGARVALEASLRSPLARAVAAIGCPAAALLDIPLGDLKKPALFLMGDRDHVASAEQLQAAARQMNSPAQVAILPGADHLLWGYEQKVGDLVAGFLAHALQS